MNFSRVAYRERGGMQFEKKTRHVILIDVPRRLLKYLVFVC